MDFVPFPNYYYNDQTKQNEVGRACSMHRNTRNVYKLFSESLKARDHLEEPDTDGRNY
jgi:hypothetical protein